jgi:hypothetical protein
MRKDSKSYSLYFLMLFMGFQAISGLFGGLALVIDPSGELLKMPLSMLAGSPFDTFLIPGMILFTILGIFPTIVFYGLWKMTSWAWKGSLMVSAALIIWIGVEIWMVGYHAEPPLQLVYGLLGLILLGLVLMPTVRNQFTVG